MLNVQIYFCFNHNLFNTNMHAKTIFWHENKQSESFAFTLKKKSNIFMHMDPVKKPHIDQNAYRSIPIAWAAQNFSLWGLLVIISQFHLLFRCGSSCLALYQCCFIVKEFVVFQSTAYHYRYIYCRQVIKKSCTVTGV